MKDPIQAERSKDFARALLIALLVLSGCSMQRPASSTDSVGGGGPQAPLQTSESKDQDRREPLLKVDYLTPLEEMERPRIYIYKEKRRLYVLQSNVLVRDYPIGLGSRPKGDKKRKTDGKTPEGEFRICAKDPSTPHSEALLLSYPSVDSAEKALSQKLIGPVDYREILTANEKNLPPPEDTPLGGDIFIHGGGAHTDWTDGSIALYDSDMKELFAIASKGTRVVIRP